MLFTEMGIKKILYGPEHVQTAQFILIRLESILIFFSIEYVIIGHGQLYPRPPFKQHASYYTGFIKHPTHKFRANVCMHANGKRK